MVSRTYIEDLGNDLQWQVNGLVALMEGEHVGPFNLGNPGEFTMLELAEVCFSDRLVNLIISGFSDHFMSVKRNFEWCEPYLACK